MTKTLKIGLFGFGCVGQGLYDVFTNSKGFKAEIAKICIKDPHKKRSLPAHYFTLDANELLDNPDINMIVELINNADEAYDIVTRALKSGKSVVSANKKMIAEHFDELIALQKETGTSLLYEASSCGSIPIIRTLEEYYDNELLFSVKGIMNGSSNYILSKMLNEQISYDTALKQAQQLGFAEIDPTLDVGGFDAKYKLIIVAAHSHGIIVKPEEVFNYGIQNLSVNDMRYASEKGMKIRLVARVFKLDESQVTLYVMPQFVRNTNDLYEVENEYNGLTVEAAFSDRQFFRGKGAGGHPTGSAVLSDISASRYEYRYEYRKMQLMNGNRLRYSTDFKMKIYFRYTHPLQLIPEKFISIHEKYESEGFNFVIATVNLRDISTSEYFRQEGTFMVELPWE